MYEMGNSGTSSYSCPLSQKDPPEWGQGGEGEWRGSAQPVGGGGGGGGGGDSDPGGGGGSFATASTTDTPSDFTTPANPSDDGSVIVSFVTS
jgi:hypothetical protein